MTNANMLERFDSVEDMPVPEEMIGAYLEDMLPPDEREQMRTLILQNDYMEEFVDDMISEPVLYVENPDDLQDIPELDEIVIPDTEEIDDNLYDLDSYNEGNTFNNPPVVEYDYTGGEYGPDTQEEWVESDSYEAEEQSFQDWNSEMYGYGDSSSITDDYSEPDLFDTDYYDC